MLNVTVQFPLDFPPSAQGHALLAFERYLRMSTSLDVRVLKVRMGDDSKLRMAMTPEERASV
jgi:hypothetical protein